MKKTTLLTTSLLAAATAWANGTRLPYEDMDAVARGYAYAATADSPSAIYFNPAGIAQLPTGTAEAGVCFLRPETTFRGSGGREVEADSRTFALPYLYAAQPLPPVGGNKVVVGAGMYAPFGLSSEWDPSRTGFRTLATRNALAFRRYALSAATHVGPTLMLGASAQYNRVHVDLNRGIGLMANDRINFTGRGDAWSYNVGALFQPSPQHSFGVQYQSRTDVSIDGTTSYDPIGFGERSSVEWPFPSNYTVSYSFRPDKAWNFEIGYDRTQWSRFGTVVVNRAVSGPLPLVFAWKDSSYYEFGGTRTFESGWHVSAGGCWSGNSIPSATFNPTVIDYDRWLWNVGVGFRTARWKIASLLQYSPARTRAITGSLRSLAGESADGTYDSRLLGAGVQVAVGW